MADNTIETDILLTGKDNGATAAIDGVSAALKKSPKGSCGTCGKYVGNSKTCRHLTKSQIIRRRSRRIFNGKPGCGTCDAGYRRNAKSR